MGYGNSRYGGAPVTDVIAEIDAASLADAGTPAATD